MAKKASTRRHSEPEPLPIEDEQACSMPVNLSAVPMASLGTPSVSGATTAETGAAVALTASIDSKTDGAVLTWEGVGVDIFNSDTGGLTEDQDHNETINLVFKNPGSYSVRAGYSDLAADNSPQYSANHTIVVSAPADPPNGDGEEDPFPVKKTSQESASLVAIFTEQYRPIAVRPVPDDDLSFDVVKAEGVDQPDPNEGEFDWLLKWLSFHFTGQITDARDQGYFRLTLDSKDARVVPGGGATPSKIIKA